MRPRFLSLSIAIIFWVFIVLSQSAFCAQPNPSVASEQFYVQATNLLQKGHFLKPAEPKQTDLSFSMAPLLIQQTLGAEPDQEKDRFGTLEIVNGALSLNPARPTVYSAVGSIQINSQPHNRFTYLWCYSLKPAATGSLSLQGVRITADSK